MMQWISKFGVWLVRQTAHTPMKRKNFYARILSAIFWHLVPKRRHVTLTNLRLCFPEKSEEERYRIARKVYWNLARAALDHGLLWEGSADEICRTVRIHGLENLEALRNRPLLLITPHGAALDAVGIRLNLVIRGCGLYQVQRNPVWDEAILKGRKRFSDPVLIAKSGKLDIRKIVRVMREGLPFYYLPDQDSGINSAIFVPFCGVQAATLAMAGRLARVTDAKVIFVTSLLTEDGYEVNLSEPWENFPVNDPLQDTLRVSQAVEAWVKEHPDQYMWVHRRFKTRPEGEASVY